MKIIFKLNFKKIILLSLSIYFTFFIFYDLNWGAPYYFHPDERNIASSISQLSFPRQLNPNFFAYGSFPIYTAYFLGIILNFLFRNPSLHVSFESAIIILRIISAVLTLTLIPLIYLTAKEFGEKTALFSLLLSITSVAFFQFSHFGTFEIWIAFFTLLAMYLSLKFLENQKIIYFILVCLVGGFLSSLKLSSIVLLLLPLYLLSRILFQAKIKPMVKFKLVISLLFFPALAYIIFSPFNFLDFKSFLSSMKYEGSVAWGNLPVFYTGSFIDTIPVVFQFQKILPFLINPFATLVFIPSFIYLVVKTLKKQDPKFSILLLTLLLTFISGSFLFVKWTRYVIPAIPFIYISIGIFLEKYFGKKETPVILLVTLTGVIFSFSFIKSARIDTDTRIQALSFARPNIPSNSTILSEVYDLGIVPFNNYFGKIKLFNFYDVDSNPQNADELSSLLKESIYIILPSQRIYHPRTEHPKTFPKGNKFYKDLFEGKLGFHKVFETPCDVFCKITYSLDPNFNVEETASVFDRPTVYIFKKK